MRRVPRRVGLLAALLLVSALAGLAPAGAAPTSGIEGSEEIIDLSFPVAGPVGYGDDYDDSRGSRGRHRARDLTGVKLQRIHAAMGGEVCYLAAYETRLGGWEMAICGDDGHRYVYSHLNDDHPGTDDSSGGPGWAYAPVIEEGARVERGQWIGWMGDSGNAEIEFAQLHFSIQHDLTDPEECRCRPPRLDPTASLRDAQERGDVPIHVEPDGVGRLEGASRIETAVTVAQEAFRAAPAVVIAPAGTPQEALVGGPLAARLDGPVLLSFAEELAPAVADEVARLGATEAVLLGRADQLGPLVETELRAMGLDVRRLATPDVTTLSVAVARELAGADADAAGVDGSAGADRGVAILARGVADDPGATWPDALSVGPLAAHLGAPILLSPSESLPPPVAAFLAEATPPRLLAVGGEAALSETVTAAARRAASAGPVVRLAGADRYATSAAVASAAREAGLESPRLWIATGADFPDALAAGPAAARQGAPLLLVNGDDVGPAGGAERWLAEHAGDVEGLLVVGGPGAVEPEVAEHAGLLAAG